MAPYIREHYGIILWLSKDKYHELMSAISTEKGLHVRYISANSTLWRILHSAESEVTQLVLLWTMVGFITQGIHVWR